MQRFDIIKPQGLLWEENKWNEIPQHVTGWPNQVIEGRNTWVAQWETKCNGGHEKGSWTGRSQMPVHLSGLGYEHQSWTPVHLSGWGYQHQSQTYIMLSAMGHALWSVNIGDTGLGLQWRPSWSRVNESKVVIAIATETVTTAQLVPPPPPPKSQRTDNFWTKTTQTIDSSN